MRGASSSSRWQNCPGSINLTEKLLADGSIRPSTNRAAAEGTAAHLVLSACLEDGEDAVSMKDMEIEVADWIFIVDDEMVEGVQECIDWVHARITKARADGFETKLYIEKALSSFSDEDAYGTADIIIVLSKDGVDKLIVVVDFKYGRGVTVEPTSDQNYYYSYLAVENYLSPESDTVAVESWIAQPRIPHPEGTVRPHYTTALDVTSWWYDTLLPNLLATKEPEAELVIGEHCKFCPNKGHCPALKAEVFEIPLGITPSHLTDEELGAILQKLKALTVVQPTFEQEALRRARSGDKITGFKLVRKKANRAWKDKQAMPVDETGQYDQMELVTFEDAAADAFGLDAYAPAKMKSPAQIEKLDGGQEFASKWAFKPDMGLTLAPDSDKRAEVLPNLERLRGVARRQG